MAGAMRSWPVDTASIEATDATDPLPAGSPVVEVIAAGSIVPEAVEAVRILHGEEIAANLIVITSAERLAAGQHGGRLEAVAPGVARTTSGTWATLIPVDRAACALS